VSAPRRAVYRALIGGYEHLREEEVAHDSELPFICFTDDPGLTSETWEIVLVEPRLPRDLTRSARALKIIGHPALADYDETLWVDNTVALTRAPDDLFDDWLSDADVAAPLHSYRTSVLAEAEAVIEGGLDDYARVYEQLAHQLMDDGDVLEENPHWTGMLARRRTPVTDAAMQTWWEQVLRHSRRDQLSFVPAMRAHGVRLRSLPVDSHESPWHEWPRATGRDPQRQGTGLRELLRPPAGRIGALEEQLGQTTHAMQVAVAHREEVISDLTTELSEVRADAAADREELDRVRHERNLAHGDLAAAEARLTRLKRRVRRSKRRLRRLREELERERRSGLEKVVSRVRGDRG
jgi:hypothetical protein